jgi:outer membrane protein OmpA-like peptidoglycan-associated protein
MKKRPPFSTILFYGIAFILILPLTSCHFQKGYKLMQEGKHEQAQLHYAKAEKHPTYGPGAIFYQKKYQASQHTTPSEWVNTHSNLCALETQLQQLPIRKLRKLHKYEVTSGKVQLFQQQMEGKVINYMIAQGTIAQMDTVLADTTCQWTRYTGLDSVRIIVVNKTVNPKQPILEAPDAINTRPRRSELPPGLSKLAEDSTLHCSSIYLRSESSTSYFDAQAIATRYLEDIANPNYPAYAQTLKTIWNTFLTYESFCDMPQFKRDFPDAMASRDCDFDKASDTLCLGQLKPLLAFHRNNPHTYLDNDIVNQALCLASFHEQRENLNAKEQEQLEDMELMVALQEHFSNCQISFEEEELVPKLRYLAERYTYHRAVFELAQRAMEYYVIRDELQRALNALDQLQALYPDQQVCDALFFHQVYKQQWFDDYRELLLRAIRNEHASEAVEAWNTPNLHEHSLVSWGTSQEVFFARTDPLSDSTWVVTSKRKKDNSWSKPESVRAFSGFLNMVPLSISQDGRFIMLKQGKQLLQSQRRGVNRPWSRPSPMRLPFESSGRAWLSPKDSLFFIERYSSAFRFDIGLLTDINLAYLQPNGHYGEAKPLHQRINTDEYSEGNAIMGVGGRLLLFTSDRVGSIGESDAYSISLKKPNDFTATDEAVNLGVYVNTLSEDGGLTYFSEYTGFGYFDRLDHCTGSRDIWKVQLDREIFPTDLMRFAGIVLDENSQPVPPQGGFMEFTFNYDKSNQAVTLSDEGAYFYTIPSSTKVVRLFPEVAGYFSENDSIVHFLKDIERGSIVRDTFYVTSFKHLRKYFKLENSEFRYGTAEFENPNGTYPELTRLAKIATRMGAEIELHGHTDESGNTASNKTLSWQRAAAVKAFLIDKCGFDPKKISTFGYGSERPLCEEDTEECRRRNRRIEVKFKMPELPEGE